MSELVAAMTTRMRASGEQMILTVLTYGIILLLLLTAYVGFMYALALAIAAEYGPVFAALSVAIATLVVAGILVLWLNVRQRRIRRRRRVRPGLSVGTAAAATVVPMMVRASPIGSLLAIAAAAYVLSKAGQRRD